MNHPLYGFGEGIVTPDELDPDFYDDFAKGELADLNKGLPQETYDWVVLRIRMVAI